MYLTLAVDDDAARADQRLDAYLEQYYGQPAAVMRAPPGLLRGTRRQALAEWIAGYVRGRRQPPRSLRFAGDHERHLDLLADIRTRLA